MRDREKRSSALTRLIRTDDEPAFTLIELMIVILIIAVLVGIVIGVYLVVTRKANRTTAQYNERVANNSMDKVWLRIQEGGRPPASTSPYINYYYRDFYPPPPWASPNLSGVAVSAQYMSAHETKITWAWVIPTGVNLYVYRIYKRGVLISPTYTAVTGRQNWGTLLKGRVAVIQYRWTGAAWSNTPNVTYPMYMTVMAVDTETRRAYYTTYYQGKIWASGTFALTVDGNGYWNGNPSTP